MTANIITDAQLELWAVGLDMGLRNATPYLRPLTPEARPVVISEAQTMVNMVPGFNFSGAVWQAAQNYPRTPYTDQARELAQRERQRRGL